MSDGRSCTGNGRDSGAIAHSSRALSAIRTRAKAASTASTWHGRKKYANTDGTRMRNSTTQVLYALPPGLVQAVYACVLATVLKVTPKQDTPPKC